MAESASTFGEMILTEGILADPSFSPAHKVNALDQEIGHGAIFLLDIPVRYQFEKKLYEERADGELTVSRLTGSDTAEGVARRALGRDLEDIQFWTEAIQTLEAPLSELEKLLPEVLPEDP